MTYRYRENPEILLHDDHFTVEDLAELLEMSPYTIQHEVREGHLKALIADHQIVSLRRRDVLTWLKDYEWDRP